MLLVKAKIRPSKIHGTGLFADEFIPKGKLIWTLGNCDDIYTPGQVQQLPEPKRSEILGMHYAYMSKVTGRYINPGDNSKFVNHSKNPNMLSVFISPEREDDGVAARDIQKGEEITCDYDTFAAEGVDF